MGLKSEHIALELFLYIYIYVYIVAASGDTKKYRVYIASNWEFIARRVVICVKQESL